LGVGAVLAPMTPLLPTMMPAEALVRRLLNVVY